MIADEMTDDQVRDQVERADRFAASFRELVAAAIPASEAQRLGLQRIVATVDQVPFLTWCNLSNLNAAMRGGVLDLVEVQLMAVGAGPTLDYENAVDFLAVFDPVIDKVRKRRLQ